MPKTSSRFVAFYSDMSSASLFLCDAGGNFYDAEGDMISQTWFTDAGYLTYAYLGVKDRIWFEIKNTLT